MDQTTSALLHLGHIALVIIGMLNLGLIIHWLLGQRKVNGSGDKPADYWIRTIDKIVEERIAPLEKEIQELRQTIIALTGR